jgi:hypothetical protein
MRIKLIFLILIACQIALFLQAFGRVTWWEGP